ncbi:MAG: PKD domain-containing protein [Phycisphaerales bacterium]
MSKCVHGVTALLAVAGLATGVWGSGGGVLEVSTIDDIPASAEVLPDAQQFGFAACWDPNFPPSPEVQAAMTQAMQQALQFNANVRWTIAGSNGDPINLTWSFVPDGLNIPSGIGEAAAASSLFTRMDTLFGAANRATWIAQFEACFARWGALTGVNYTRVTSGTNPWDDGAAWGSGNGTARGHVRISMKNIDGGNGILAYNAFPQGGDMVLDASENWASSSGTYRFLRNTIMHEHGHGLGFAHTCPGNSTKLMEPLLATAFDGPQQDEIRGGHFFYGDILEPNATAAAATDLGALTPGVTQTIGTTPAPAPANTATLSLSDNGDVDYYKFSVDAPRLVDVTITPIGSSYLDLDQNGDGSCQTTGTNINTVAVSDLVLQLQTSNGGVTWISQDATAAGLAETVNDVLVSPNGFFVVRVSQNGAPAAPQTQLYRLAIKAETTNLTVTASDGAFNDRVAVTWTAVPNTTAYRIIRNTSNTQLGGSIIYEGPNGSFDDVTAVPGTTYFYFVRVQQSGSIAFRDLSLTGESGFRSVAPVAPIANAGPDQNVNDNDGNLVETVTLNGSLSTDADGTITNYRWNEGATILAQGASPTANVNLSAGLHTITLTVTDNSTLTGTDTVLVDVNRRPAANAGADQTVTDTDNSGTESVTLNGSASTDADGTIANYRWNEGATVLAQGASVTANVAFAVGVHTVTLTTTDNDGATSSDTVQITVNAPPPPSCSWQLDGCFADYNNDGGIDGDDVIGFFEAWDVGGECGDVDSSGGVDGDDVIAFFEAWDTNGAGQPGC